MKTTFCTQSFTFEINTHLTLSVHINYDMNGEQINQFTVITNHKTGATIHQHNSDIWIEKFAKRFECWLIYTVTEFHGKRHWIKQSCYVGTYNAINETEHCRFYQKGSVLRSDFITTSKINVSRETN